jgi:hypothetical protein
MEAPRQLPELLERLEQLRAGGDEDLRGLVGARLELRLGEPERERKRREPLLRPVVRLRSSRRRAASVAATIRLREARTSSSWRFRSVTSAPERRTRAAPHWSRIGVAVHATVRSRPSRVSQRDSRSVCGTPLAAPAIAIRAGNSSSSTTRSRKDPPTRSSTCHANASQKARFAPCGTIRASWSVTTTKLGMVLATALAKSHWRCSSTSRRLRSVMSIPPAMIRTTLPCSSASGADCHAITRSCPCALVNAFSYALATKVGAAAWKRSTIASRSAGSMKMSQK